ncbi:MAG: SPFH domain-containing protein [Candidatus Izemoplasmatales bacterium]
MFGFRYVKFQPNEYVIQYSRGKIKRDGTNLAFNYYVPVTTMIMVPVGSKDIPFMLEELTSDFQTVTVQGHLSYRIIDFNKVSELLNFGIDIKTHQYLSEDPMKLSQRIINIVSVLVKKRIEGMIMTDAIKSTDNLASLVLSDLNVHSEVKSYGIEILGFSLLAVTPNKETSRALEAQTREEILKRADEAIYERRNSAILQERKVKENELNTEITVVDKKREITEAEMESALQKQQSENKILKEQLEFEIAQEEIKKSLVLLESENNKTISDARIYELGKVMETLKTVDQNTLKALASLKMNSGELIALAFQDLANNASKIGELNISPDLLKQLAKPTNE